MSAEPTLRRLVVMAAGTGGHIMPGLAVARELQARGWQVSWLGTSHGMENRLVPPSGLPMDTSDIFTPASRRSPRIYEYWRICS